MANIERILIVDESESNLLFFEMLLQQLGKGFKVYTASVGAQAEVVVKEERIQFIICAWEMNSMPGTVFVQRVRQDRSRRYLPCLIFSKRMKEQDIVLTKELGFENVLGMPFDKKLATDMILRMVKAEDELPPIERKLRKIEQMVAENKLTEALKMYDPSLTRNKQFRVRALLSLAEVWLASTQLAKADKTITEIMGLEPENTNGMRLRARWFSMSGRHDEAIATLKEMSERSPKNIKTLLSLGAAYVDADRHDEARAVFKQAGDIDADNPGLKDETGKLALKEGDFPLAAQLLAETQWGDEIARYTNNIAIAHVAAGRYDEGISTYENAIRILTDRARVHQLYYNLGLACKKKGDLMASFRKLCESYCAAPAFEKAYVALARVARELKDKGETPDQGLVGQVRAARNRFKEGGAPPADAPAEAMPEAS